MQTVSLLLLNNYYGYLLIENKKQTSKTRQLIFKTTLNL